MKRQIKASLAFKSQKAAQKPSFGNNVINGLTPPAQNMQKDAPWPFNDLPVSLEDLSTINTNLDDAVTEALTGNHSAVANVKNVVAVWNSAFTLTANYVSTVANGDATLIRKAGFVPTKGETSPTQKPGAVAGFNATINGSKGAIIAGAKKALPDVCTYLYSAVPDGVTVTYNGNTMIITAGDKCIYLLPDTHRQTELYNLPSGVPYNISVFGINRAGSGPAATSVQVIPQ